MRWPLWGREGFSASFTTVTMVAQSSLMQLVGYSPLPMLRSVVVSPAFKAGRSLGEAFLSSSSF